MLNRTERKKLFGLLEKPYVEKYKHWISIINIVVIGTLTFFLVKFSYEQKNISDEMVDINTELKSITGKMAIIDFMTTQPIVIIDNIRPTNIIDQKASTMEFSAVARNIGRSVAIDVMIYEPYLSNLNDLYGNIDFIWTNLENGYFLRPTDSLPVTIKSKRFGMDIDAIIKSKRVSDTTSYIHFFVFFKDISGMEYLTYQVSKLKILARDEQTSDIGFVTIPGELDFEIMNQNQQRFQFFSERFQRK